MEHSFIADIESTTYSKLRSLDTDSPLRRSDTEKLRYSFKHYEQHTSVTSSRLNYISGMGHKCAAMKDLEFALLNVISDSLCRLGVHNFMLEEFENTKGVI